MRSNFHAAPVYAYEISNHSFFEVADPAVPFKYCAEDPLHSGSAGALTWTAPFSRARHAGPTPCNLRPFSALSEASGPPTGSRGSQNPLRGKRVTCSEMDQGFLLGGITLLARFSVGARDEGALGEHVQVDL